MITKITKPDNAGITEAVNALRAGSVVALPTETVYGLAGDIANIEAIRSIFIAKDRPLFDPLIVHISAKFKTVEDLASIGIVDKARLKGWSLESLNKLIKTYWPGPLTILFPKGPRIDDMLTAGSEYVAVRMPNHPVFQKILFELDSSVAAPSANRFGHVSPTSAEHVYADLAGKIPLIIDGGRTVVGVESTIIKLSADGYRILRPGGLTAREITAIIGQENVHEELSPRPPIEAPGTLAKHYAPEKQVVLFEDGKDYPFFENGVLILPKRDSLSGSLPAALQGKVALAYLSERGDDLEAAQRVYDLLRRVEEQPDIDLIVVKLPDQQDGLWPAIRDRLKRAAASES